MILYRKMTIHTEGSIRSNLDIPNGKVDNPFKRVSGHDTVEFEPVSIDRNSVSARLHQRSVWRARQKSRLHLESSETRQTFYGLSNNLKD